VKKPLPDDAAVQAAMDGVLTECETLGRRATVTSVEDRLGIAHATFYRNYPALIAWFQQQNRGRAATQVSRSDSAADDLARLRRDNSDLRKLVAIYANAIRQLTLDNAAMTAELDKTSGVTTLRPR
jgi:hypothetical protein